ncbi:hypothetical protein, partial [Candidatus Collinsella stercoripullorum]|uniref:hypothetical protein n=1 Tax=Candidatus Collinsella stercoripullorum TaxID=2838522 RepID=UPI0022E31E96
VLGYRGPEHARVLREAEREQGGVVSTIKNRFAVPEFADCWYRERLLLKFAVHTVKSGLGKTEALFYFIRNAFAHGGFRISTYKGERYFALENRKDGSIRGRAVIRESTLLGWIKLIGALRGKRKVL